MRKVKSKVEMQTLMDVDDFFTEVSGTMQGSDLSNRELGTWPPSSFRERSFRSGNMGTISFP
jgi:hypothetical protein